jgi:hypothetical protein
MSDYTRVYNLTIKDSLPTGNSNKVIKGTELDVELNAVASAIASKADSNDPTFTGTPLAPTPPFGTSTTQLATTAFVQTALQAIYPIGSVYINATVNTNPATLLGFGTWSSVGDGRVLVNQDVADTSFDVLGETGGSKDAIVVTHTHTFTTGTESAAHTHSGTTSYVSNDHTHSFSGTTGYMNQNASHSHGVYDPGHSHIYRKNENNGSAQGGCCSNGDSFYDTWTGGSGTNIGIYGTDTNHTHNYSGTTSGISANHNHSITTGTQSDSHTHSGTTASTGSSGVNGNLQPYVVVRMWKRTA